MIKAKPRKKREVKINEKQEIVITREPTQDEIEEISLATILINISRACINHKKVWDKELNENDGFVDFDKIMLVSQARATADKIYDKFFQPKMEGDEGVDIENNFFFLKEVQKQASKVILGVADDPQLTIPDLKQRLPAGFTASLVAWIRSIKELTSKKMRNIARRVGIEDKEINKLCKYSDRYMIWVYEDISFEDEL